MLQDPDALREELKRRSEEGSPTREAVLQELRAACKRREAIPLGLDRLVDGYAKGLVPEELMKPRVEALQVEQREVQSRVAELEVRLQRLELSADQEAQAVAFAERIRNGLDHLDFPGKRELLRLVVEDITCTQGRAVVHAIIPLAAPPDNGQLCTPARR